MIRRYRVVRGPAPKHAPMIPVVDIACAKCGEMLLGGADMQWTAADLESRICECRLEESRKQDREARS